MMAKVMCLLHEIIQNEVYKMKAKSNPFTWSHSSQLVNVHLYITFKVKMKSCCIYCLQFIFFPLKKYLGYLSMNINFRAGNWVHGPPGRPMDRLQEFMDPEILCECTCVRLPGFTAFHRSLRVLSPPKCINKNTPTLYSRLFCVCWLT